MAFQGSKYYALLSLVFILLFASMASAGFSDVLEVDESVFRLLMPEVHFSELATSKPSHNLHLQLPLPASDQRLDIRLTPEYAKVEEPMEEWEEGGHVNGDGESSSRRVISQASISGATASEMAGYGFFDKVEEPMEEWEEGGNANGAGEIDVASEVVISWNRNGGVSLKSHGHPSSMGTAKLEGPGSNEGSVFITCTGGDSEAYSAWDADESTGRESCFLIVSLDRR